jgi:uncharacterized protein YqjF (DUF2071 family)
MNLPSCHERAQVLTASISAAARRRMLAEPFEPLLLAGWRRVLMIHLEVDADALRRAVPFELDLYQGRAFVSLVAFSMCGLRPRTGGRLGAWLLRPIATHDFLNVRTYVRHAGEYGIHFLAEWLSSRLAAKLGPVTFSLPYRFGKISYEMDSALSQFSGRVVDGRDRTELEFRSMIEPRSCFQPCDAGSLDEWLMERYTAFNCVDGRGRYFRVWHPPWPQCEAQVELGEISLLTGHWPWIEQARLIGANYSPGFPGVWMGRPHRIRGCKIRLSCRAEAIPCDPL